MNLNLLLFIIVGLYGILIGSFLNVCIYRIPRREDIVFARSHCTSCDYVLKWYDLVPIVSFVVLKGHCRKCGEKVSIRYPMIELLNSILYIAIFTVRGFGFESADFLNYNLISVIYCIATSAFIVLSFIDFATYEIPVGINIFLFFLGLIRLGMDLKNWSQYVIGFFAVSLLLYIIYVVTKGKAIGGGDVKLMAVGGLLLGWQNTVLAFLLGCILGSVIHIIRMKVKQADHVLALGPYLSMGMYLSIIFGDKLWAWYLNFFIS